MNEYKKQMKSKFSFQCLLKLYTYRLYITTRHAIAKLLKVNWYIPLILVDDLEIVTTYNLYYFYYIQLAYNHAQTI